MSRDKITSLDVARRAGVSQSAVSRVFTPGASASKKTIEKVRKAAEELGYRPNPLARAMITGKSRIIGLVVAYLENQFYPIALERLSRSLQAKGYHVLVFLAENATAEVAPVMEDLIAYQVDGIVTASVTIGLVIHALMYAPQPAIMSEMFPTRMRYSGVSVGYQVTAIVAGSVAPMIAVALLQRFGTWVPIAIYLAAASVVTIIAVFFARETRGIDLADVDAADARALAQEQART